MTCFFRKILQHVWQSSDIQICDTLPFFLEPFEKQAVYGIKDGKYLSLPGRVIKLNILQ